MKAKLGPDHPDTLYSMHNLAVSYMPISAGTRRPSSCTKRRWRCGKPSSAPTTPTRLRACGAWQNALQSSIAVRRPCRSSTTASSAPRASVVDPGLIPAMIDLRLRHFAKAKDGAGCRATAEMWEKLKRTDADSLYDAACFCAVTAGVLRAGGRAEASAKDAAAEADRAMGWLKQAVAAGYDDAGHMAKDEDLDPLRDREDFQKLVAELRARHEKEKK